MDDEMASYKRDGCPVIHPEEETNCTNCAMCSYVLKVQTTFHKRDMYKLFCKTMYYSFENFSCKKRKKYGKKLKKYYLNAQPV